MVADIRSGSSGSFPGYWLGVAHESIIFFDAGTDYAGRELWAHDQSTGSTWMVANLVPDQQQPSGSNPGDDIEIMYGDTLYFSAFTLQYATELWAYDTSNDTTWLVRDIHMGSSANPGWYMNFIHHDVLYFTARDVGNVHDLWAHNQSNTTTWKVAAFGTEPDTHPGMYFHHLIGDTLYFDEKNGPIGRELMAYDLINGSTRIVADMEPGAPSSNPGEHMSVVIGDTLIFDTADDSLWAHDTSNDSTWRIEQYADWNPGENSDEVVIGTTVYFQANDGMSGSELWAYDVVNDSTWLVSDLHVGSGSSYPGQNFATSISGILYFDASTHSNGRELWAHDPHDGSTWNVIDISKDDPAYTTADPDSDPGLSFWALHGGCLFFDAHEFEHGRELWKMWFDHSIAYN
jgi:ELWxxDGT repeat protein